MIYADFLQLFLTRRTQKDAGNKNNSMRERVNHTPTALFFNFRWWQYDRRGCLREDAMYFCKVLLGKWPDRSKILRGKTHRCRQLVKSVKEWAIWKTGLP